MATLRLVSFFSPDVERICSFYVQVFGFTEVAELRSALYRGVRTPNGLHIGFHALDVRALLNLGDRAPGLGGMLTFELDSAAQVDQSIDRIVAAGGVGLKQGAMTFYGVYQAVATDPDGNAIRVNFYPEGKAHYRDVDPAKATELDLSPSQLTL